jgi:phosphoglycolate phosphatase
MFRLSELLSRNDITIQCHDSPDADAIASAFAVYSYLRYHGKSARIVYAGRLPVTKQNLLEMMIRLSVPVEFIDASGHAGSLVVVDSQYGAGNVTKIAADNVFVFDHHRVEKSEAGVSVINPHLGSCSTLVWDLLRKEDFPFGRYPDVSTALYYGLFSDTNGLSEIYHPLDKDMRDSLPFNRSVIKRLQNMNLSLGELNIAGLALTRYRNDRDLGYAIFKAEPCDPNILGFISDLALQVDSIDACVVYNRTENGAKLSVRSCSREIMASDFVEFLARGVGSGGGHAEKAGGYIDVQKAEASGEPLETFLEKRVHEYFNSYDVIDAASHSLDVLSFPRYGKKRVPIGFVRSADVFEKGTPVLIRTLEGDAESVASDDIYFMVGIVGEAYPITAEKFHRSYERTADTLHTDFEYSPTVRNRATGEVREIIGLCGGCAALGEILIHAKQLERNTKVFTSWNADGYMSGKPGDFLAVRQDDFNDVYIIRQDIFHRTYERI